MNEFAAALDGWEWDVALLQEVPPWWPSMLAQGASWRVRLTSRNLGLLVRRAISARNPDVLKANGGGCNAILVREGSILSHAWRRLCVWPERRYVHGVRLADLWVVNVHSSTGAGALADSSLAAATALRWADGAPLLFGGDVNLRGRPALPGLTWLGGNHVDHFYGPFSAAVDVLGRGRLSDHPPVRISF